MLLNTGIRSAASTGGASRNVLPTTVEEQVTGTTSEIAKWGDDNLFPQNVWADAERSSIIPEALSWKARAWYGNGLMYGFLKDYDENGNDILEYRKDAEIEQFFQRSRLGRYGFESLHDLASWAMAFPELCRSMDGKKITAISAQEAMFCRFSKPNRGVLEKVYISANWHKSIQIGIDTATKVPVIDPYYDPVASTREAKGDKFIYPLAVPSPGKSIYQVATWNSVRLSGWLDVAAAIPEFKKQLFANQLSIKYLIEVNREYWDWKYVDWQSKTEDERRNIIKKELEDFSAVMTGTSGAGKSIMTVTVVDPVTKKEFSAWKVTAIDDKLKSGFYVEDSQEAASHIYTALGVAPSLMGISPGKGMGGGSGSEPRVLFNNYISTSAYFLDLVTEPLEFIRDYNGWSSDLRFRFKKPLIMTLDTGKPVAQQTK